MSERRVWFTSDTHFNHAGILRHCAKTRRFSSVQEMNGALISNWNAVVKADDLVYHLGDFAFGSKLEVESILSTLRGKIHLIAGNHDQRYLSERWFKDRFERIDSLHSIRLDNTSVVMCHYPLAEWDGYFRGAWHLHGHTHGNKPAAIRGYIEQPRAVDVGVDLTDLRPVSFRQILEMNEI